MFLTDAATVTVDSQVDSLMTVAEKFTTGLLNIGTTVFNWAMNNPLFVIGIIIMIIFTVIAVVKSLSHR